MIWRVSNLIDQTLINKATKQFTANNFMSGINSNPDVEMKNNTMMKFTSPYDLIAREYSQYIIANEKIGSIFATKCLSQLYFLWYNTGDYYNYHIDNYPIAGVNAHMSMTVFLNDDYEGGELVVKVGGHETVHKPKAGDAIIYDTGLWHKVNPVTKGDRKVVVGWLESMISNTFIRNYVINYGLSLNEMDISNNDLMTLEQFRINLMREYG